MLPDVPTDIGVSMPYELRAIRKHSDVTHSNHSNADSVSQSRISLVNNVSVPDWSVS
ncbi:hypothetical protein AHF37_11498 [Paragonimus kellicotti]|nr:hypothetical protein AHF37_11498 [Paragonimus kellicotti]